MPTKIVNITCKDGLKLKGLLTRNNSFSTTIIHVHGSCGNFYENEFLSEMRDRYESSGINFLAFSNRGHDCIAEAYNNDKIVYVGGSVERLSECVYDIDAAISFCKEFSQDIILQAHSFGCLKVIYYLLKTSVQHDVILLSPADTLKLEENYISPKKISDLIYEVKNKYSNSSMDLLPEEYFGISQGNVRYFIPITPASLIDLLENPILSLLSYASDISYNLSSNSFIYIGGNDALQTTSILNCKKFFKNKFKHLKFITHPDGDHHFHGIESIILEKIIDWVRQRSHV